MTKPRITGSFVALITPMNNDGSIDYAGFKTILDFQEEHGTAAVLIMGSTGEVSMLTPEERRKVMDETIKMKSGKMEFWFGCTGPSTEQTIDYVKYAGSVGADGAIIAAPSYICAPEDDIVDYFLEIADASPIPIGIYNNPPRVKTDLPHTAILRLAEHPNIVINKESTARVGQIAQTVAGNPDMIIASAMMEGMGGVDLACALKAIKATKRIPFVLLTSFDAKHPELALLPKMAAVMRHDRDVDAEIATALDTFGWKSA
jgi:4-hydroxy-tetrahydrodipicolinate synthase